VCYVEDVASVHVLALDEKVEVGGGYGYRNFGARREWRHKARLDDAKEIVRRRWSEEVKRGVFGLRGSVKNTRLPFDALEVRFQGFEECVPDAVEGYLDVLEQGL
jgi:nucleoside-diphosphate-sugar epimerase